MMKKISQAALMSFAVAVSLISQARSESTGFSFLKVGVGAQAQAMGNAFSAASQDASATYWNPSALSRMKSSEVFAYHSRLVEDFNYSYIAYARLFKSRGAALGLAFGRFSKGSFEGRDENGNRTSDFTASDNLFSVSLAKNLSAAASVGVGIKMIQSSIDSHNASGAALDLSGSYRIFPKTNLAMGISHLGPSLKYDSAPVKLPAAFSLGVNHSISILTVTSEFRHELHESKSSLSFGGQMDVGSLASIRAGYASQFAQNKISDSSKGLDQFAGLAMGLGLKFAGRASVDYAFLPMGELGGTHHMSISWRFK